MYHLNVPDKLDFGPRLSDEEYEKKVVLLHSGAKEPDNDLQDQEVRRRELDIEIDYRLGKKFPPNRRNDLWMAQERVSKKRILLLATGILKQILSIRNKRFNGLAGFVVSEFGKVLSKPELEMFFGKGEVQNPTLPLNDSRS